MTADITICHQTELKKRQPDAHMYYCIFEPKVSRCCSKLDPCHIPSLGVRVVGLGIRLESITQTSIPWFHRGYLNRRSSFMPYTIMAASLKCPHIYLNLSSMPSSQTLMVLYTQTGQKIVHQYQHQYQLSEDPEFPSNNCTIHSSIFRPKSAPLAALGAMVLFNYDRFLLTDSCQQNVDHRKLSHRLISDIVVRIHCCPYAEKRIKFV